MKFYKTHTLKEISKLIDSEFIGNDNFVIYGMNEIHVVEHGDIVFVDHPKYYEIATKIENYGQSIFNNVILELKKYIGGN